MSHPNTTDNVDIKDAAILYGCQTSQIKDFIARGMLHIPLDKQEIEELRQRHLYKQISGRSNPRRKRH